MAELSPDGTTPRATGDEKILLAARKHLKTCVEEEESERRAMMDDLKFCTLDQWPADVRRERENDNENGSRPCLTIDKINQYIVQVVNDMRQGKPGIVVRPQDDAGDPETAKIIKGMIRNIEDQSNADIPYYMAGESATKIGLGFFRITTEYVSDDSFDQEIFIRPIPNTFSVYLGRHVMPDGSDAKRGFIVEVMPIEKFKTMYPKAKHDIDQWEGLQDNVGYWRTSETVTVVEYFYLERIEQELYFLADGTTISKADYEKWPDEMGEPPAIQDRRAGSKEQLRYQKMTGVEVLEKRDLPMKWIPIVEVIGRESTVDGQRMLWGLVRPAKDSLRMYNYFASTITEKMALAPKAPFIGAKGQFKSMESRWQNANRKNYSYLEYDPIEINGNAVPSPQRQGAIPMETALANQLQIIEHDVQTSLGIFKAGIGESESQQSGKAILALQRESDTGVYHFGANLGMSIRHAGRIIVDMIPHYYDTKRIVRILGEDGTLETAQIDPDQEQAYTQRQTADGGMQSVFNPSVGKYDVSVDVGPSYNTKRMETAAVLTEIIKASPETFAIVGDVLFRSLDFPQSDLIAERLKRMMPPQAQEQGQPVSPEAQAQIQQMGEQLQAAEQTMQAMQGEIQKLESGVESDMAKVEATREAKMAELALEREVQAEKLDLARKESEAKIELARAEAEAEYDIEQRKLNQQHEASMKDLEFKQSVDQREQLGKVQTEQAVEAESLAPNLIQSMKEIVQEFAHVIEGQQKFQQEIVETQTKLVEQMGKTKHIDMVMPDGRKAKANVTMQ